MDQNANTQAPVADDSPDRPQAASRPDTTLRITRGIARLLHDQGDAVISEMKLANGRRADLVGLSAKGILTIVEVKSCQADFDADHKWPDYLDFCDRFYFAVETGFPTNILPPAEGLIVADRFGGAIVRQSQDRPLVAARRKAVTLRFARQAAFCALRHPAPDSDLA